MEAMDESPVWDMGKLENIPHLQLKTTVLNRENMQDLNTSDDIGIARDANLEEQMDGIETSTTSPIDTYGIDENDDWSDFGIQDLPNTVSKNTHEQDSISTDQPVLGNNALDRTSNVDEEMASEVGLPSGSKETFEISRSDTNVNDLVNNNEEFKYQFLMKIPMNMSRSLKFINLTSNNEDLPIFLATNHPVHIQVVGTNQDVFISSQGSS